MVKKEKTKNKILFVLGILFIIGLTIYFLFRDYHRWVIDIIPEFLGVIVLGFFITYALRKNISFKQYLITMFIIVIIGILAYIYGINNNVRTLKDLAPEILGSTGLSLILSLLFKKRIWQ